MKRDAMQGRRKAAFFFFLAAVAASPAFSHDDREQEHRYRERMEHELGRHGRNAYSFITYFYIDEIEREDGKIEIEFNSPVDPRTVSPEKILINGEPLPSSAWYKLSRKGNKIEIAESPEWRGQVVSIEVVDLYSVNGIVIETIPPIFLGDDEEYERDDDLEFVYWYWYDANGGKAFKRE